MRRFPKEHIMSNKQLFNDPVQRKRYICALLMILLMVGVSELMGEKEIIFPEMAALTIGMWIVDKKVWTVSRLKLVLLMSIGAIVGVCIVRYSPFPLIVNLCISFAFSAICLQVSRTTLIPQISACMLPILLVTESWVYPIAVTVMSLVVVGGQKWMEKNKYRKEITYTPVQRDPKKNCLKWGTLLATIPLIAAIPIHTGYLYCILPPLIVTYVEFSTSKAGFRGRPLGTFLLLAIAAVLGSTSQLIGHIYLHLPETVVALFLFICLFILFEWWGKFFAPAGAIALVPMIISPQGLIGYPLQVMIGAALLIFIAMVLFLKCYKWPKSHLIYCLVPAPIRTSHRYRSYLRQQERKTMPNLG